MTEPIEKRCRFAEPLTDNDIDAMINDKIPIGTKNKEKWAINVFKQWLNERNRQGLINGMHVFKDVDDLLETELDYLLSFFILEV